MSHNIFAVFLMVIVLTSSGCLDFGDDELELTETDDNTKQEPVGETNMTSLEKRITDLEAKIAEYEMPKVNFMEVSGYNYISTTYEYNDSDDGYLLCSYVEYYERTMCNINAQYYDPNGLVTSYSWEASETSVNQSHFSGICQFDVEPIICLSGAGSVSNSWTDVCKFGEVNQILTLTIYDNDGNSASASYDLDYDAVCTLEEPDNEEDTDFCDDGEESDEGGMIRTCVNGAWDAGQPIICPQNHNVTNNVCVPCPEGSTNEPGDDASGSDTRCDVNHGPQIEYFYFEQDPITTETTQVCLELSFYDVDDDAITGEVIWLINMEEVDILGLDECFALNEYDIAVDDELRANIFINDGRGGEASAGWSALIEEEEN